MLLHVEGHGRGCGGTSARSRDQHMIRPVFVPAETGFEGDVLLEELPPHASKLTRAAHATSTRTPRASRRPLGAKPSKSTAPAREKMPACAAAEAEVDVTTVSVLLTGPVPETCT